jgi:hypothetical protein
VNTHVVGCTGKRKFSTESMAHEKAADPTYGGNRTGELHPYKCGACGCWHLSKMTQHQADVLRDVVETSRAVARARVDAALHGQGFVTIGRDGIQRRVVVQHVKRRRA